MANVNMKVNSRSDGIVLDHVVEMRARYEGGGNWHARQDALKQFIAVHSIFVDIDPSFSERMYTAFFGKRPKETKKK